MTTTSSAGPCCRASGWGGFCEYVLVNDHDAMVADGVADEKHGWFECYEIQRKVAPDIQPEAAGLLCTWREVYAMPRPLGSIESPTYPSHCSVSTQLRAWSTLHCPVTVTSRRAGRSA